MGCDFRSIPELDCLNLQDPDNSRKSYSEIIDALCKKRSESKEKRKESKEDDSEDKEIITHPGDAKFYNQWESDVYNIPGLDGIITTQAQRTTLRRKEREQQRGNGQRVRQKNNDGKETQKEHYN